MVWWWGSGRKRRNKDPEEETWSIVIPALNEAGNVGAALKSVFENRTPGARPPLEAIVVDGGSRDATRSEARRAGARVVAAPRGRGAQLNAGWRRAKGDWVLFLHADSRLPQGYDALIRQALQQRRAEAQAQTQAQQLSQQCPSRPAEGRRQRGAAGSDGCCCQRGGSAGGRGAVEAACAPPAWGCFSSIDVPELPPPLRALLRAGVELRTRVRHEPYGDQALWVRRACLEAVGGFQDWPLLEDLDLARRLGRAAGPPAVARAPVAASGRRWQRLGFWRTWWHNQRVLARFAAGEDARELARFYASGAAR